MMKKRGRNSPRKEEVAEDWCFVCKDGGLLMVCDYKQCMKSYHSDCVGKDDSFLETRNRWICNLHSCSKCHRSSNFHCLACPTAVCQRCIKDEEFVKVKGKKGLCQECLKLALLVEEKVDVDSDGEKIDFRDRETYEGLFREYWEIINEREQITLENLQAADVRMKKGKDHRIYTFDSEDKENGVYEFDNLDDDVEERMPKNRRKISRGQTSTMKRKSKSSKKEFIGWGSRALINFLESIGTNVSEALSQHNVTAIITNYIKDKQLSHPEKKKLVVCDAGLQSVLGRKKVHRHKIFHYLDSHFSENQHSEEDEIECSSEEKNDIIVERKRSRKSDKDGMFPENMERFKIPKLNYASIVPENINIVYLRRSLVQKLLLEEPEMFESKVIGSFVKVKSDPKDYFWKNSHQLVQVTGTTRNSGGENDKKIFLQVSGRQIDINISSLTDHDISEEDCEELKLQIKGGLLKQPTLVELKEKAKSLHHDITKHWIDRELNLLQSRIDRANEKRWRRELFGYLERKQILQASEEQSRLLNKVPEVIPDLREGGLISEDTKGDKKKDESSSKAIQMSSLVSPRDKSKSNAITSGDGAVTVQNSSPRDIAFVSANNDGTGREKDQHAGAKVSEVAKEEEHRVLVSDEQADAILKSELRQYTSSSIGGDGAKNSQPTDVEKQGTEKGQRVLWSTWLS